MIHAECHSDDHAIQASFDATPYIAQATALELANLRACGWGGDYPADDVARFMAGLDPHVQQVFDYIEVRGDLGFECHINGVEAEVWLAGRRYSQENSDAKAEKSALTIERSKRYGRELAVNVPMGRHVRGMTILVNYTLEAVGPPGKPAPGDLWKALLLDNEVLPVLAASTDLLDTLRALTEEAKAVSEVLGQGEGQLIVHDLDARIAAAQRAIDSTASTY